MKCLVCFQITIRAIVSGYQNMQRDTGSKEKDEKSKVKRLRTKGNRGKSTVARKTLIMLSI